MAWLARLAALWNNLTRRARRERELDEEIRGALDLLAAEKIEDGFPPDEGRRLASIELGGVEQIKERVREVRAGMMLESAVVSWMSIYDVSITNPYLPQMPALQVPMVLVNPNHVSFGFA